MNTNLKEQIMASIEDLLDKRDFDMLSSEERLERMAQINEEIDMFSKHITNLVAMYEKLEEEEMKYQEEQRILEEKTRGIRDMLSRKKEKNTTEGLAKAIQVLNNKLSELIAKPNKTVEDEQTIAKLQKKLNNAIAKLNSLN